MRETANKDHSIKFRIDQPTESLMNRAQSYLGTDKSKFIRESIREKAKAIIAQHEKTTFSNEDWYMFFDQLDNVNEPTDRMKKAAEKYKTIKESNEI